MPTCLAITRPPVHYPLFHFWPRLFIYSLKLFDPLLLSWPLNSQLIISISCHHKQTDHCFGFSTIYRFQAPDHIVFPVMKFAHFLRSLPTAALISLQIYCFTNPLEFSWVVTQTTLLLLVCQTAFASQTSEKFQTNDQCQDTLHLLQHRLQVVGCVFVPAS